MKINLRYIILILLVISLSIVLVQTISLKRQVILLTEEKQSLTEILTKRVDDLARINIEKQSLQKEYAQIQKEIDVLTSRNSAVNAENSSLKEEVDAVKLERDILQAKFLSLPELNKAIKELREQQAQINKIMGKRRIKTAGKGVTVTETKTEKIVLGNRGYIVKNGQPTCNTAVKIDVEPAPQ